MSRLQNGQVLFQRVSRGRVPIHKLVCKDFSKFKARPSGEETTVTKILYFPENANRPEWKWLEADIYPVIRFRKEILGNRLGPNHLAEDVRIVEWNAVQQRSLEKQLNVQFRGTFLKDGSRQNQSLVEAT